MGWMKVLKTELYHMHFTNSPLGHHLGEQTSWIYDIKMDLQATETDGRPSWTKEEKSQFYEWMKEWIDLSKTLVGEVALNPDWFSKPEEFPIIEETEEKLDKLLSNFAKLQKKYSPHNLGDA